eukprot:scaffold6473_cov251-Ochromonas_danica.AAC.1
MEPAEASQPIHRVVPKDLLESLARYHECRIVHRDLRPTNILYSGEKLGWQIVDFDLAEKLSDNCDAVDTWINTASAQYKNCGGRIEEQVEEVLALKIEDRIRGTYVKVSWSTADDQVKLEKALAR